MENLKVMDHKGIRVLTTSQLAEKYGTESIKIQQNFSNNRLRYVDGVHYFSLSGDDLRDFKNSLENFELVDKRTPSLLLWTEKGCLLHAKSLNTDKAWEVYEILVDTYFRVKEQSLQYNIPKTYIEALRLAADIEEQRKQLEVTIEEQKPKVLFADSVASSNDDILVRQLAKIIKQNGIDIGEKRLYEWLRDNKYIEKYKNFPTQKALNMDLFRVKETAITHASGKVSIQFTPKVTAKGQQYFINKFLVQ